MKDTISAIGSSLCTGSMVFLALQFVAHLVTKPWAMYGDCEISLAGLAIITGLIGAMIEGLCN